MSSWVLCVKLSLKIFLFRAVIRLLDQQILNQFMDLLAKNLIASEVDRSSKSVENRSRSEFDRNSKSVENRSNFEVDRKLIEISARFLLLILDSQPLQLEFLKSRQKNLRESLENLPKNKEMELLEFYLETDTVADFELHRRHQAAAKIQATWRGYHTRCRLAKAYAGFRTLQSFYRLKKMNSFLLDHCLGSVWNPRNVFIKDASRIWADPIKPRRGSWDLRVSHGNQ